MKKPKNIKMQINQEQRAYYAWKYLTEIAASKGKTSYKELARAVGISHHRPTRYFLGLIQDYCLENKLPPLTILVVNKSGKPGEGFIAWDVNNLVEGRNSVYAYNWGILVNPFSYAYGGSTKEEIVKQLLDAPNKSREVYSIIQCRGMVQRIFRDAVMIAYDKRCAICDFGVIDVLEASHIVAWKDSNETEKMDVRNGILLCATHHKLFDYGYITINEDYTINYNDPELQRRAYLDYELSMTTNFRGKKIRLPKNTKHYPSVEYFKKHKKSFEEKK